jgi:predicted dehydrogenase
MTLPRQVPSRSKVSRRRFLQATAAASAAVAAPTIIPSSALGLQGGGKEAPSNRTTLGFIGIGKQSWGHLNSLTGRPDTQTLAVCDVHTGRRENAKKAVEDKYAKLERKDYKGCDAYVDFRELIARTDIDAIVIGTPDHWHTIPIIHAAQAKKHIYCEKPLTLTIAEAKAVIDVVRKHGVIFQTGSQQRSEGPFREVCEYIRSGRLGKITKVEVFIGKTSKPCDLPENPTPDGLAWDFWLGQAPKRGWHEILCSNQTDTGKYPFNPGWRDYREFSGGHVTDWGAHHFDITQWALGMDESGPDEIHPPEKEGDTQGATLIYKRTPVGDNILVTHKTSNNGITFYGEKGEIFVNRGKKESKPGEILSEKLSDNDVKLEKSPGHRDNWLQCIKSGKKPICHEEVGARSVTVCHLVNLAYWHHKSFKWDPAKWEFADAADNKLRDRERRDPWQLPKV